MVAPAGLVQQPFSSSRTTRSLHITLKGQRSPQAREQTSAWAPERPPPVEPCGFCSCRARASPPLPSKA